MSENDNFDNLKDLWKDETEEIPMILTTDLKGQLSRTEMNHKLYIGFTVVIVLVAAVMLIEHIVTATTLMEMAITGGIMIALGGLCFLEWKWRQGRIKTPITSVLDYAKYQVAEVKFKYKMADSAFYLVPPALIAGLMSALMDTNIKGSISMEKLVSIFGTILVFLIVILGIALLYRRKFKREMEAAEEMVRALEDYG